MFWHQKWSLSYMFVMTESSSHLFHIMWPWNLKDPTATVKKMVQKKKVTFDSVFLLKLSLWMIETITKRKRGKKGKRKDATSNCLPDCGSSWMWKIYLVIAMGPKKFHHVLPS